MNTNILKSLFSTVCLCGISIIAAYSQTYTSRTISSDGLTSTWGMDVVRGSAVKIKNEVVDNEMIFTPSGSEKIKFQTSNYLSCSGASSIYIPVPAGSAGNVSQVVNSQSESRYFQLYINGSEGTSSQRLWSKPGNTSARGPQDFDFTAADITTYKGQTYLHFKDNNTEMKITSFTVTLTTGSYTGPVISSDATLSALTYNGTAVPNFSPSVTDYEVELPSGTASTAVPTVVATVNESHASASVTPATSLPGTTSVLVTAEDGSTKTYTITFTIASAAPKVLTATWTNIKGTATVDNVNLTVTGQVVNGTGLTAITPTFTGNNIASWTPTAAQNFSNGAVAYTFSSSTGETTIYNVSITEAPALSSDATLSSLSVSGQTINFSPSGTSYTVALPATTTTPPTVSYTVNHSQARATMTAATSVPGQTVITVTAEDGTTNTYTISFTLAGVTYHEPDIYPEDALLGGYATPLVTSGSREYEVYYLGKAKPTGASSDIAVAYTLNEKNGFLVSSTTGSTTSISAADGWFSGSLYSIEGSFKDPGSSWTPKADATDEFSDMPGDLQFREGSTLTLFVQGYDQFSILAYDADATESKDKHLIVTIDNSPRTMTLAKSNTVRRFDMTTAPHKIVITAVGSSSTCKLFAFSLRCGTDPRVKHILGNDTTQEVLQTLNMKPVTYYTKYNNGNATTVEWDNGVTPGFALSVVGSDAVGDTLELSGVAQGPVGVYPYHVVTRKDGAVTSSVAGSISIISRIEATSQTDTIIDAFMGEEIDEIVFQYYALSGDDVTLIWGGGTQPGGITTRVDEANHRFILEGVPTTSGNFPFTVTVLGGNSVTGRIDVGSSDLGTDPILYLFKNKDEYLSDNIYNFLNMQYNLVPRKAKSALREASQYDPYVAVIASEFVDANNEELLALAKGEAVSKPMLNMKAFSYSASRLGWGDPDNGSVTNKSITVMQEQHPVMQSLNTAAGSTLTILDAVDSKGLMPMHVTYQGTLCIATAKTRGVQYDEDGEDETFLHEIPASMRGGAKYLCFPLATNSSSHINGIGKRLLTACMDYLLNDQPSVALPELKITAFSIDGHTAVINQEENTIRLTMPEGTDLTALQPSITVLDAKKTFVTPASGESEDFSGKYNSLFGVDYTVSDHINVRVYKVFVTVEEAQGIEEVYSVGEWVDVYDIAGRKVLSTNEDIFHADLPHGMYLVVTPRGTMKVMR